MLIGYNLYLRGEVEEQNGTKYEEEPKFLYLSYVDRRRAEEAKYILEQVYGEGKVFVEMNAHVPSLVE